ncbi:acyltransferase [Mucilaginibacter lacusdianchii]|uniref:acyltransferase n=1 Tax=Mucilaginibacter lacusdianchii TaxID=2684211 RepID=UPI00131CD585|nr:acyltransferase family protein [Mucilaginibacter sp. JXJ CY 39]
MKETISRTGWIDNIRVIATIAVIAVHVSTPPVFTMYHPNGADNTAWWIGNAFDSLFRFCVPLFVMITGGLLLPQQIGFTAFLKKRLTRILLPFVFWSLIYIGYNLALNIRDHGFGVFHYLPSWVFAQIVQGAAPHLWYIYMIVGIYLFIPIVKPWVTQASNKAILFFLGIWLMVTIVTQQQLVKLDSPLDLRYFSGYMGYLILGYYLSDRLAITSKVRAVAALMLIAGYVITLAGTFFITKSNGHFLHTFYEYLTFNVILTSAGAFILIKGYTSYSGNSLYTKLRDVISRYGYGIYLGHLLVLNIMSFFRIDYSFITPLIGIPACTMLCLGVTCAIVYLLNKLPFGKYVAG